MRFSVLIWFSLVWLAEPALAAPSGPAADDRGRIRAGQDVLQAIRRHMAAYYDHYTGTVSRRLIKVTELDPDDGSTQRVKTIERRVREYISREGRSRVISCRVDGKTRDNDECADRRRRVPMLPAFGRGSEKNYRLQLVPTGAGGRQRVHRVEVIPLAGTERHFRGHMLFDRNYRLLTMAGTIADLPTGLQKFSMTLHFRPMGKVDVVHRGHYEFTVYIPLVVDKVIRSEFRALDHQLLP